MNTIALILLLIAVGFLTFISFRIVKDTPSRTKMVRLEADLENERKSTAEKLELLEESETRLKTEFENLANKIFEEKGTFLTEQNRDRIGGLLQPFKEQLESFRKRVDEVNKDDTERSAKLVEQVRQVQELTNKVSDDANSLAKAIKGDIKKQGDWGEIIVERIFEASGLEEGREFESHVGLRGENGDLRKPDFIIYLPGNKAVIVDSKVSLTAFERFYNADNSDDNTLSEHLKSVRKHVKELHDKDYSQLLGNKTLDFVIMCIPLEPAYQAALQNDKELIYDLAKTNVVITGPTTLMITLKLIAQIWRRENENQNAEKIADKAGRIYDQVVLIVDAMSDAQKKLSGVTESFETAMKRLKEGRGNLIGRVEEIRHLGAKVNKQLPAKVLEGAIEEDNQENGLQKVGNCGEPAARFPDTNDNH